MADRETCCPVCQEVHVVEQESCGKGEAGLEGDGCSQKLWSGQRSGDEAGAAEASLAGQAEVLPKRPSNRSLLDVKPAFCVSVCACVYVCV